ncbi:hypothetical protein EVAR_28909_1 [Eumeta japonica]|uniref:Uncharacterized protein n=1 Tax=Eumeta variegata TaxID=151549 RepID=A0A4C1X1U2_EUMVA|nr:hypothetical protein EVAR_28909_1 [Eumeta japonica]
MGLRRLITEFLWPPSSSIIRLWLPYSTKVLVKTNQTSPNSMGLRRLITEFLWPPSSSIIRLWLPYSTKVLVKTNQTSPNSMGLRRLITEFPWPPSSSIIRLCYHIAFKLDGVELLWFLNSVYVETAVALKDPQHTFYIDAGVPWILLRGRLLDQNKAKQVSIGQMPIFQNAGGRTPASGPHGCYG